MKNYLMLLITLFSAAFWNLQPANSQFKISAEIRPRFEYKDGVRTLSSKDDDPAFVTTQRTRINLDFKNEDVETFLAIQDVRTWGDEVYKTDNSVINVFQAYAGYYFSKEFSLRIGRQELSYDNKRLIGNRNWNNVGASHDLFLARYEGNSLKIHIGTAYNNDKNKTAESNYPLNYYKHLIYLWINKSISNNLSVSIMNIADGKQVEDTETDINTRFTSGFFTKYKTEALGITGAFYYQYGRAQNDLDINAFYFSISPYCNINKKVQLLAGLEYLSGDDAIEDNSEVNTFDKLYGNGHSPYGYMDYFTEIPAHTKNGGLMDAYLRLSCKPSKKTYAELTVHNFQLTGNIADSISEAGVIKAADKQLGVEIDFMLKHKLNDMVQFNGGYSTMFANGSMEILKGGDSGKYQHWLWLSLIFKPTFFKHEINE
jgi:hypothetical protein